MGQINASTKAYPFGTTATTTTTTNIDSNYCGYRLPCGMCSLTYGPCLKPIKHQYPFDGPYCKTTTSSNVTSANDCT